MGLTRVRIIGEQTEDRGENRGKKKEERRWKKSTDLASSEEAKGKSTTYYSR